MKRDAVVRAKNPPNGDREVRKGKCSTHVIIARERWRDS